MFSITLTLGVVMTFSQFDRYWKVFEYDLYDQNRSHVAHENNAPGQVLPNALQSLLSEADLNLTVTVRSWNSENQSYQPDNYDLIYNTTVTNASQLNEATMTALSYDFIVKLGAGDTLQGSCTADCGLNGAIRQIASIDGTLISP